MSSIEISCPVCPEPFWVHEELFEATMVDATDLVCPYCGRTKGLEREESAA